MYYITVTVTKDKEILKAITGSEQDAKAISWGFNAMNYKSVGVRSLNELFDNNVEIPMSMKWIVESDSKYQKREADDRIKNVCGLSFPSKKS